MCKFEAITADIGVIMSEYFFVIDYIEAFLWTVTYMLIALVGLINKDDTRLAIPKIPLLANFAWEVASVIELEGSYSNQGGFIRSMWLIFDIFILLAIVRKHQGLPDFKKKVIFWGIPWVALTVIFHIGFNSNDLFMPISAFIIDVEMAILFWVQRKKLDPSLRLCIAITKLLGDILAGVYCSAIHYSVIILAVGSFIFNVLYMIYAVKELKGNPDVNDNFKKNLHMLIEKLKNRKSKTNNYQKRRKYKKKKKTAKNHRKK